MNQMRLTRNYTMTNNEIFNVKRMLVVIMILLKYNALRSLIHRKHKSKIIQNGPVLCPYINKTIRKDGISK